MATCFSFVSTIHRSLAGVMFVLFFVVPHSLLLLLRSCSFQDFSTILAIASTDAGGAADAVAVSFGECCMFVCYLSKNTPPQHQPPHQHRPKLDQQLTIITLTLFLASYWLAISYCSCCFWQPCYSHSFFVVPFLFFFFVCGKNVAAPAADDADQWTRTTT